MVIPYENDAYFVDPIPGNRFVRVPWYRVLVRFEHQPDCAMQIHRKLSQAVALQRVRPTGDQFGDERHSLQVGQPVLKLFRARKTKSTDHAHLLRSQRAQFGGCKIDVHWTAGVESSLPEW